MPQMGKTEVCQHRSQSQHHTCTPTHTGCKKLPKFLGIYKFFLTACRGSTLSRGYCKSWKERMLSLQAKEADDFKSKNKEGNRQQLHRPWVIVDQAWVLIYTFFSYVMQRSKLIEVACIASTVQWNPNFLHHSTKSKLVPMVGRFENLGVKLLCLTRGVRFSSNFRNFKTARF